MDRRSRLLSLDDFRAQVLRNTDPADYPLAGDVRSNVLVYSSAVVGAADRRALQSELIRALADGPGVVVFEGIVTITSASCRTSTWLSIPRTCTACRLC